MTTLSRGRHRVVLAAENRAAAREWLGKAWRFGCVGVAATAIHCSMVIALVQVLSVDPVAASVPAFVTAFLFSYRANHGWTFARRGGHRRYLVRFFLVTSAMLGMNLGIMYGCVDLLGLHYVTALLIVVATLPLLSFLLNACWAFR